MPSDPTRGRSWRHDTGGTEKKREAQPQWRREPATPGAPVRRVSRKTKIAAAALGFIIFCGLLVWAVMLLMPPKAACLVPIYAGYEENLAIPPNIFGKNCVQNLVKLTESGSGSFVWGSGLLHLKGDPTELRTDEPWDKDLGQFKEKTVVVFLSVHAGADMKGAYLLPANSNGWPDEKNRLPLEKVLDRLAQIDREKNKVLVLDATQISADWPLGLLHNGFARELDKLDSKIASIPNLVVLSASDVDQRSWASEEWRQTVFAHFVTEGLKGAADENGRGRINALDLHNYVHKSVGNWVRSNRDAVQQPVLLPHGEKGKDLAKSMDLVVVKDGYQAPNPKELPAFAPPPELLNAWKTFQDLDKEVPSPAVYSPNLWRQYQEFLLRFEQAIRADDKGTASALAGKLNELEQRIKRGRIEELNSAQNSLPMPAAAGLGRLQSDLLNKQLTDLWEAAPADQVRTWESIQKAAKANNKAEKQLLRVQILDLLIKRVAEDPSANLEKGAKLALALEDAVSPRPAEAHFLVMLNRDRVENPQPASEYYETVKTALGLRLLAEKTALNLPPKGHPYSERVYPWMKTLVEEADQNRRTGQDLLFASERLSWTEARKRFQAAEKKYQEAQEIGLAVRAGLEARDLAYEILPALSKWAALRRPSDDAQRQNEDSALLGSIEELWKEVHRLDRQLEKPIAALVKEAPKPDLDDPKPCNLAERADLVNRGLKKLRDQFDAMCQKLAISADLQIDWYDIEGALAVPFMEPDLRMKLITNSRRISLRLLTEVGDKPAEAAAAGKKDEENAQKEATRQGRMALADLGKGWFDKSQTGDRETFDQVHSRIDTLVAAPNWPESLAKAQEQIGIRWQQMPVDINARADAAPKSKLDQALEQMEFADRLARLMDPGSGGLLAHDPVEEYRRLLFLGLLNAQAERTFEDHWFDLDPKPDQPPYYRVAGSLFLDDANKLVPQPERLHSVKALQEKLNKPGRLEVEGPTRLNITSEKKFGVTYRIRPPKDEDMPKGFPVAGVKIGKDLEFVGGPILGRAFHELTGKDQPLAPISLTLRSPFLDRAESNPPTRPDPVLTSISLDGLYRGQRVTGDTAVNLYPLPEIAQVQPQKPAHGSLAVRADPALLGKFGPNGAVAIVLDCSGSMWYPDDPPFPLPKGAKVPEKSRFAKAVGALRTVLQDLPRDTIMGLWIFAEHPNPEGIRVLRPPAPWDPNQLNNLTKKIDNLIPYYQTPLVESMWEAKEGLERALPRDFKGPKSIVVLTDGADDEFDKFVKRGGTGGINTIPRFMEKRFLEDSGYMVNMVFFQVIKKEEDQARADFGIIEDKNRWKVPGKMIFVKEDPQELRKALRRALRQNLRYWVENPDDGSLPQGLDDSLEISGKGSNDQWVPNGLAPAGYNLWVQQRKKDKKHILLERGDLLLMQLNQNLEFERLVVSKEDYSGKVNVEKEGWRMAVLQNQRKGDRGLQMLTTLERLTERSPTTIQQVKPRDIWFEIQPPANVPSRFGVRWEYLYVYPAATWGFDVPEWPLALAAPNLASPQIKVWWSPDQEAAGSAAFQQGADFNSTSDLTNRSKPVEGDLVTVESVSVEDHMVQVQPGQMPEKKSCLVVRMAYAKGKPVWAKISGPWTPEGFEHRFYQDANKYTGLFWPAPPNAEETLSKLNIISVESFKRNAESRGFTLDLKDAKVPEARDDRPSPRLLLK